MAQILTTGDLKGSFVNHFWPIRFPINPNSVQKSD